MGAGEALMERLAYLIVLLAVLLKCCAYVEIQAESGSPPEKKEERLIDI